MLEENTPEQRLSHSNSNIESTPLLMPPGELLLATFVGFDEKGSALVNYSASESTIKKNYIAQSTIALNTQHIGRQVAVMFISGELSKPIVIGLMRSSLNDMLDTYNSDNNHSDTASFKNSHSASNNSNTFEEPSIKENQSDQEIFVNGKKLNISAQQQLTLQCGESSITLTESGKVLIKGKYLSSRSTGVNRITGGSVQVN